MANDTILIGKFAKSVFDKIMNGKDIKMNFKDQLKMALSGKNKQKHRIAGGTRAARRLQASHSEKHIITKGQSDSITRDIAREQRDTISLDIEARNPKGTNSKTDI